MAAKANPAAVTNRVAETDVVRIPAGRLKRIHVNQHVVRRNAKTGGLDPPISVKLSDSTLACQSVEISGPSSVIYSPARPLRCGARLWVETKAEIIAQ
jgi:hypothetical protein